MDFDQDHPDLRSAHVIVVANEKGGTGKSTLSMALDAIEAGARNGVLTSSQRAARQEIGTLLEALGLPERMPGKAHLEARHLWFERVSEYYKALASSARNPAG